MCKVEADFNKMCEMFFRVFSCPFFPLAKGSSQLGHRVQYVKVPARAFSYKFRQSCPKANAHLVNTYVYKATYC